MSSRHTDYLPIRTLANGQDGRALTTPRNNASGFNTFFDIMVLILHGSESSTYKHTVETSL